MKWTQSLHRIILAVALFTTAAPLVAQDQIPWITDLSQARELAERQHRLVLLHFWSDDCVPCKQVERQVFNRPEFIRALTTGYIPVKINANQKPNLADFYNIERVPTDVIVTPEGREVQRFQSLQDPNQYIAMLDGIRSRASVGAYDTAGRAANPAPTNSPPANSQQAVSSTGPYGSFTPQSSSPSDAGRYGQPQANQSPATQPQDTNGSFAGGYGQGGYGGAQSPSNALAQPSAPQQQELAPRYANPYASEAPSNSASLSSRYGQQPSQGYAHNAAPSRPQPQTNSQVGQNVYGDANTSASSPSWQQNQAGSSQNWQQDRGAGDYRVAQQQPQPSQPAPNTSYRNPASGSLAPRQGYAPGNQSLNASNPAPQQNAGEPKVSLEGYCPVTLVQNRVWTPGDKKWGAVHEGLVYLFAGPEQQQQFLANPHIYAPLMAGYDPVRFAESGQLVPGRREFGLYIDEPGPIALFADEAALERFHANSGYYFNVIRQAKVQQAGNATR